MGQALPRRKKGKPATESFADTLKEQFTPETSRNENIIGYGQSPKRKAVCRTNDFSKLRKQYRIGFWNIRTLLQPEKLAETSKEMDNNLINILGLRECRWLERGKFSIRTENKVLLFSGTKKSGEKRSWTSPR